MVTNPDFSNLPNLYDVLGISPSTPKDEFDKEAKRSYRRIARENHPDRLQGLPEEEKRKRTETMYMANAAYEVLSDSERRRVYDQYRREQEAIKRSKEGARRTSASMAFESMFGNIFRGTIFDESAQSIYFGEGGLFGSWGLGTRKESYDYFLMPENDWGLLSALITAYEHEGDGKWKVKRTEADQRDWMPESVYLVKKEGDRVSVFRKVTDWRHKWNRGKPIKTYKKEEPWKKDKEIDPSRYLGEYYLRGSGRAEGVWIPGGYGEYLTAMKFLAGKIARREKNPEDNYEVQAELRIINQYTRTAPKTKDEDSRFFDEYETRRKVSFDDFWGELKKVEGEVIQLEGHKRTPEGQMGDSGESKG